LFKYQLECGIISKTGAKMENSKRTTKEVTVMLTESEIEAITIHMEANPCSGGCCLKDRYGTRFFDDCICPMREASGRVMKKLMEAGDKLKKEKSDAQ
jgi:hypothetical protein